MSPGSTHSATVVVDINPNRAVDTRIEGLVADKEGRLYTVDLKSNRLFRITVSSGKIEVLTSLPRAATGMAFDRAGNLYLASGLAGNDVVLRISADQFRGDKFNSARVETFARGVPGAAGLAFDRANNLYVASGSTGKIHRITQDGKVGTLARGFISNRKEQRFGANGLAFGPDGRLYVSNTGSGRVDRITIKADGTAGAIECFASSPLLLGADGIAFAMNGDLYVAANERNAIVRISPNGQVSDIVRNGNAGPLEFPASLAFIDTALYVSNFDQPRGVNAMNAPGVGASITRINVGVARKPLLIK